MKKNTVKRAVAATAAVLSTTACSGDSESSAEQHPDLDAAVATLAVQRDETQAIINATVEDYHQRRASFPEGDCQRAMHTLTPPDGANRKANFEIASIVVAVECGEAYIHDLADMRRIYNREIPEMNRHLNDIEWWLAATVHAAMVRDGFAEAP